MRWWWIVLLAGGMATGCSADPGSPSLPDSRDSLRYRDPRRCGTITDARCSEVSGLAASRLRDGWFWIHNDSGDEPRLFAIDSTGRLHAIVTLQGADALDWEDIASIEKDGRRWIYVGDIGDNLRARQDIVVYRIEEPHLLADSTVVELTVPAESARFSYPDGPSNCEALLVHPLSGDLYFITKTEDPTCQVYRGSWPSQGKGPTILKKEATLTIPFDLGPLRLITAGDIAPSGNAVILRTYLSALEYRLPAGTPFSSIWRQSPSLLSMPPLPQAEAVCYGRSGAQVFTTTENLPAPLFVIDILR